MDDHTCYPPIQRPGFHDELYQSGRLRSRVPGAIETLWYSFKLEVLPLVLDIRYNLRYLRVSLDHYSNPCKLSHKIGCSYTFASSSQRYLIKAGAHH